MAELYHYTTTASLLGMLKDCSAEDPYLTIWATHCNYLNDRAEFLLGEELCCKAICEYEEEQCIPENERVRSIVEDSTIKEYNKKSYEVGSALPSRIHEGYPYLFSLSRAKDSLPMWGLSAKDGNGIAIVFDEEALQQEFRGQDCIYCQKDNTLPIKATIAKLYVDNIQLSKEANRLTTILILKLIYKKVSSYIKHKSFEFEQEFRVVATESSHILFREKAGLIVPYVEQKIPVKYIKGIIVGPTADFDRMKEALSIFLINKNINVRKINIIQSEVPYRG